MKNFLAKIPEQVKRLSVLLVILVIVFIVVRSTLIPNDFGKIGHYRASAVQNIANNELHYTGQEVCVDCHDDIVAIKTKGYHKNLSCEVCHGPSIKHTESPDEFKPQIQRNRSFCPTCHEYLPSRPTGFPQIVSASHNPRKICVSCHNPHNPVPPVTPKGCEACHAEIAATKSLSFHSEIPCTKCHVANEKHKLSPRDNLPTKPTTREFCGQCHAEDANSPKDIPRINMATHEPRYVCWQCHYPHLPEAQ